MALPTPWLAPSSTGASGTEIDAVVSHAGGYWFDVCFDAVTGIADGDVWTLRYTTNPAGTWVAASLPTMSAGLAALSGAPDPGGKRVWFDGTYYGFAASFYDTTGTDESYHYVFYCTDPAGTWSSNLITSTQYLDQPGLVFYDGSWVVFGRWSATTPIAAVLLVASSPGGTFSVHTSAAETGVDLSSCPSAAIGWINGLGFDGTHWVSTFDISTYTLTPLTNRYGINYSTSLLSGWALSTTMPGAANALRPNSNGHWSTIVGHGSTTDIYTTDNLSAAWNVVPETDHGLTGFASDVLYDGAYWIAVGAVDASLWDPGISYLTVAGAPSGAWTMAVNGFTPGAFPYTFVTSLALASGIAVSSGAAEGQLRYIVGAVRQTYLRQRQSPRSNPTRISTKHI